MGPNVNLLSVFSVNVRFSGPNKPVRFPSCLTRDRRNKLSFLKKTIIPYIGVARRALCCPLGRRVEQIAWSKLQVANSKE